MNKTERMRREATVASSSGSKGSAAKGNGMNRDAANRSAAESSDATPRIRTAPTRRNVLLFSLATILLVAWMAVLLFMALGR
jgi:hypothetical protein